MPKIWFLLTCCLLEHDAERRRREYDMGIRSVLQAIRFRPVEECRVILVEGNGKRETYLDDYARENPRVEVMYTENNVKITTTNKGKKEMCDIIEVVGSHPEIGEKDMVVKMTGRYRLGADSPFIRYLFEDASCDPSARSARTDYHDALIRTGAFMYPSQEVKDRCHYDCVSGLFAARAWIFQREFPYYMKYLKDYEWMEWCSIMAIQTSLPQHRIKEFDFLGVYIRTVYFDEYRLF
jgi:hypothetical protein